MCAPVTAVKQIYAVGCRRRRATIERDVDVHAAESIPKIDPVEPYGGNISIPNWVNMKST